MTSSKILSTPLITATYLVACTAIWSGLVITLHVVYSAANIICYGLFDTAPTATVITGLLVLLCLFSIIPRVKASFVKIALRVCSFIEIIALSGSVGLIAMKAIYSPTELDNIYNDTMVYCGFISMAILAVVGCILFFLQSRTSSIKLLSLWTLGLGLMTLLLSVISFL